MIKDNNTTIAYHCPHCGHAVLAKLNMFAFSNNGNLIKIKCGCEQSEMQINITKEKKFRISVPCVVCPTPHTYTVSQNIFFERDIFGLSCKFTALNICFIGKKYNVNKAVKENEAELLKVFAEFEDEYGNDMYDNIMDIDMDLNDEDNNFINGLNKDDWFDQLYGEFLKEKDYKDFLEKPDKRGIDAVLNGDDIKNILGIRDENNTDSSDSIKNIDTISENNLEGFALYKTEKFDTDEDLSLNLAEYADFEAYNIDENMNDNYMNYDENEDNKLKNMNDVLELDQRNDIVDLCHLKPSQYQRFLVLLNLIAQFIREGKYTCGCKNGEFKGQIMIAGEIIWVKCLTCGKKNSYTPVDDYDVKMILRYDYLELR